MIVTYRFSYNEEHSEVFKTLGQWSESLRKDSKLLPPRIPEAPSTVHEARISDEKKVRSEIEIFAG